VTRSGPAAATARKRRLGRFNITFLSPVEVETPTEKRRLLRADDAIPLLIDAFLAPNELEQRQLLAQAMATAVAGTVNEVKFNARGDRRGRPPSAETKALLNLLRACVEKGEKPTPAARKLLRAHGFKGDEIKGRVDYLVAQLKHGLAK
jgi:hypothetical protein